MIKKHITNTISQLFHKVATKKFPTKIQHAINKTYVKIFDIDMHEFKAPQEYETLNELFTRELQIPREFINSKEYFISPTDSTITAQGIIKWDIALQIKGMRYSVKELLTDKISEENIDRLKDGKFVNLYLSPRDYHRYHSIYDAQIVKLIHVPGKLYPVNYKYLNKKANLFVENERVILELKTKDGGLFYMVFVGALNVGKMVFDFEPEVETNSDTREIKVYNFDNLFVSQGECLGYFKMGSTVLVFWEQDMVELHDMTNTTIKFSQKLATLK